MNYRTSINEGMLVCNMEGKNLGKVSRLETDAFIIEKGIFFTKDYSVRYDAVQDIRDGEIIIRQDEDLSRDSSRGVADTWDKSKSFDINNRPSLNFGANRSNASKTDARTADMGDRIQNTTTEQEVRVPVVEEQLSVEHHTRDAGAVRVRKEVITEQKQITVPVRREEIIVERVAVAPGTLGSKTDTAFDEKEVVVSAQEEVIEIHKRPVVREEVRIRKEVTQGQQTASTTLRREEVKVDDKTDKTRKDPITIREDGPKPRQR